MRDTEFSRYTGELFRTCAIVFRLLIFYNKMEALKCWYLVFFSVLFHLLIFDIKLLPFFIETSLMSRTRIMITKDMK